ncbi:Hypothetical predicted protein [Pelobates cultripes]|uniref:Uncharacterized protein n=1 Tax=Pelobates cultripes TaxID=61616 RepID=A0AAD1SIL4_PELCU|nr:Hypothetical predicted protein [Pelobates cultripes]
MAPNPQTSALHIIERETKRRYDRIFGALWEKLVALMQSPQKGFPPGNMRQGPQHGSTRGDRAHPRNPTRKKGNPVTWNCTKATHSPHKTTETQETLKAQLQRRPYRCAETRPKLQRGPDWTRGQQKEKQKMAAMKLPYREGNDS